MSVTWVNEGKYYTCLSSDLTSLNGVYSGSSSHITWKGAMVFAIDTNLMYFVNDDLTVTAWTPSLGSATISNFPTNQAVVNPQLTVDNTFCGQINVSSSTVNVSGSTLNVSNRNGFSFLAAPANTATITAWIVNAGSPISRGYPLPINVPFLFSGSNLNMLDYGITGGTSGCVCWAKI